MMKYCLNKKNSGFTLVETFVAITILLIAVLIPLSVLSKAIGDGLFIRNKVTAFYLAQEGMELVINKVHSNIQIPGEDWLNGMASCPSEVPCSVSLPFENKDVFITSCGGECPVLKNLPDGTYGYSGSEADPDTIFRRVVVIGNPISATYKIPGYGTLTQENVAIPVTVTVFWKNKDYLTEQSVVVQDYIYNNASN